MHCKKSCENFLSFHLITKEQCKNKPIGIFLQTLNAIFKKKYEARKAMWKYDWLNTAYPAAPIARICGKNVVALCCCVKF